MDYWKDVLIIVLGFSLTMIITHYLVKATIWYVGKSGKKKEEGEESDAKTKNRSKIGLIVGRCENILIVLFILLNEFTALVIIVAVKGLVRREDIEKEPGYYLVGTIVNLTLSILLGLLVKAFLFRFGKIL